RGARRFALGFARRRGWFGAVQLRAVLVLDGGLDRRRRGAVGGFGLTALFHRALPDPGRTGDRPQRLRLRGRAFRGGGRFAVGFGRGPGRGRRRRRLHLFTRTGQTRDRRSDRRAFSFGEQD